MKLNKIIYWLALGCWVTPSLHAEPAVESVWHCTGTAVSDSTPKHDKLDNGTEAWGNNTIQVTLNDLIAVYSGYPLRIEGKPLFACFMPGDEALSLDALDSMGFNASALQILARRSAIVQRQLEIVTSEAQMLLCMERNAPAFGYLPGPVVNTSVAPCF